jgi:ADP-heptose:LPS heptosyltransferase
LTKDTRPRKHKFQKEEVDLAENAQDMSIVDMAEFMNSYDDTASIISEMDLVIAVDTSVLHIAGALNHQTLAIIPQNPDWRWGNEGDKSKWYPSIKMFRKENKNSWEKTFNDIKEEVIKRMGEKLN